MVYQGRMVNGVVVFGEPVPLPDGVQVHVEAVNARPENFWETCSLDELAARQGVAWPHSSEEFMGGWPEDELNDGFEDAVAAWRARDGEQSP